MASSTITTLTFLISFIVNSYALWVDLSHTYNETTNHWPTNAKFTLEVNIAKYTEDGRWIAANNFCSGEHSGTHLDAPYHMSHDGWTVEQIPLHHLLGIRAAVIDISQRLNSNIGFPGLTISDITAWEAIHGRIPHNGMLIMHSGWGQYWTDPQSYFNTTDISDPTTFSFPGIGPKAAEWLVENRKIVAVGVDSASIDGRGPAISHGILAAQNIYFLENLANVGELPAEGAVVYAFPMKIQRGTGAPARVVALVDDDSYGSIQLIRDAMQSISLL